MKGITETIKKIDFESSITLCAVDSIFPKYAAKALDRSSNVTNFDQVLLFSHEHISGAHKTIIIDEIKSIADYNHFMIKELNNYIETEYALIVQWDGFIINHLAWTNEFLKYDYIGARWPQYTDEHTVGNGGFSLRSKKLLLALNNINIKDADIISEDELICRSLRNELEIKYNINFASPTMADKFSYEQIKTEKDTFGFHGFWNMIQYIDESEAIEILSQMPKSFFTSYLVMKTFMSGYYNSYYCLMSLIYRETVRQIGEETFYKTLQMALKFNQNDIINALNKSRKIMISKMIF